MDPIDYESQRSKVKAKTIATKLLCASWSNFGRHFSHGKRMNPIDIVGQRPKVKVTMDI